MRYLNHSGRSISSRVIALSGLVASFSETFQQAVYTWLQPVPLHPRPGLVEI
ncbi:MAG: hypothetical protein FGF52_03515 [Candidatus Brockarchaeota archaeon]|nr:hypothetical protein [Candidatus Brockarchaeota archaeon]